MRRKPESISLGVKFKQSVLLFVLACTACVPAVVAREPMAVVGTGPVAELPAELAGYLQVTLRACLEELNPNNTCEDPTDISLAGVKMPVKFGPADDDSLPIHVLTTNDLGIATVKEVMPLDYDGGTVSYGMPPDVLLVTLGDGSTTFACMGILGWKTGTTESITFPYSEENCTVPQKTARVAPKRGNSLALEQFAIPSNRRADKYSHRT